MTTEDIRKRMEEFIEKYDSRNETTSMEDLRSVVEMLCDHIDDVEELLCEHIREER